MQRQRVPLLRTYRGTVTDALETGFSFEGVVLPESLLATIPRAYRRVAARRREQADAWRALGVAS